MTLKIICSCSTAKKLREFTKKMFQQTCFCLVSEKAFALHCFLTTPKTAFLKHFESKCPIFSVYIRKKRRRKILSDGGGSVGGRLNNFIKVARSLGLVKCFTIFHFN